MNTLESLAASTAARISASVWSAVALASIAFNLLWSASVKSLLVKEPSATPSKVRRLAAVNSAGAAALPLMFPNTLSSAMFAILARVTLESTIFAVVTALSAICTVSIESSDSTLNTGVLA